MKTISEIQAQVMPLLSRHRCIHTMGTVAVAQALATQYNERNDHAVIAAWCHDICKKMRPDDLTALNVPVSQQYRRLFVQYPNVWHAFAAPAVMTYYLRITQKAVLKAVRWHTTGRARMTVLEAIIFVADFIEPGRIETERDTLRNIAFQDIFKAVWLISNLTIQSLKQRKISLHPSTMACYDYYTDFYV